MKVTCQLCGTKFELKKNDNRCPECAAHYHVDEGLDTYTRESTSAKLKGMYDTNSENTIYNENEGYDDTDCVDDDDYELDPEVHQYYQNLRKIEAEKTRKAKKIIKGIVITVEVIIIAFFILMPFLGKGYSDLRLEEQKVTEAPPIVEAFRNKPMQVGDYEVTVINYYVDSKSNWELPDNYVVYAVEYQTKYNGDYSSNISLYNMVEPYLETASGPTIAPMESYDASEYMVYEEYKEVSGQVGNYLRSDGGILYFVAKDDEELYGLCFDVYSGKEDDYYYRELEMVYFMEVPELEVK